MSLEFIEDGHRYFFGEEEIPSVSEIIRFVAKEVYGEADKFAMDQAADRGTRVHRAAEEIDRTGRCECDSDIAGYARAYVRFKEDYEPVWEMIEQPVHNLYQGYAGTLDRLGKLKGINHRCIVDIKSTKRISKKHKLLYGVQVELYADAIDPYEWFEHYVLQLNEDGTYKLIELEHCENEAGACLILHKSFEKTKRRKTNGRKNSSKRSG